MADEDKEPAPAPQQQPAWVPQTLWEPSPTLRNNNALFGPQDSFVPPPRQQPAWVSDQVWDMPHQQRNNALLDSPSILVPPPVEPLSGTPLVDAQDEIAARFRDVERLSAELTSAIDRLRGAVTAPTREIGIGHNQGPPVSFEELDAESKHLLALLQDKGPRPTPVDRALITEHAEKTLLSSERIRTWQANLAVEAAKLGAREVVKDLTAPLWQEVARRIVDLYHAIQVWLSLLF